MEEYLITGTKLILQKNGKELLFDFTIKTVLSVENVYIILLDIPYQVKYNRNVFGFDKTGKFLWQIDELPIYLGGLIDRICDYVKISYQNNELTLLNACSFYFVVEPYTGKILHRGETR